MASDVGPKKSMTRIYPGDFLRIAARDRYYYVIVLDKIRLFGGQLCYVLYHTSESPLEVADVIKEPLKGFYEIVDFIWAKREDRVTRIQTKRNVDDLNHGVRFFKNAHMTTEKAKDWWIYDREGRELRRVQKLTEEEKRYPLYRRIDDIVMVDLIDERWAPERDHRI